MSQHAYLDALRASFPTSQDVELELMLAGDATLQKLTGKTEHWHRREAMRLLFPDRVWHSFRERIVEGFWRAKRDRRKEYMVHGSSSSNKTGSLADLALEVWLENPKATSIYIASPYEDATESGIFAEIVEQFDQVKARYNCIPGRLVESESKIVMYDRNPRSFIKVVTIDQMGKLVGRKSRNFELGMMLVICDELPEFKRNGDPLIGVLKNLRSVGNFMLVGAGNFADPNDALGRLSEPAIEGGYEVLDVDRDQEWQTTRGGLCIRLDGHQSPNVLAGEDTLPFVTTNAYLKDLESTEGGTRTPGYYRFGRSFPMLDFNEFTVTNTTKVRAGGCYEEVEFTAARQLHGAFCDPGFGGDPCVLQFWRIGEAWLEEQRAPVFELTEPPLVIPIDVSRRRDDDEDAKDVTVDMQIAEKVKVELDKRSIAYPHFGFDDSLRGSIVQAFMRVLGSAVVALSSGGPATSRRLSAVKQTIDANAAREKRKVKTARDEFSSFITEMWFAVAMAIDAGQIRGLQKSRSAVSQLCTRRWEWEGKKKKLETKPDYKKHSSGKSPNEADALVGGVELARRLGFRMLGISSSTGSALANLTAIQRRAELLSTVKQLKGESLPEGRLRSMESADGTIRPHLHS